MLAMNNYPSAMSGAMLACAAWAVFFIGNEWTHDTDGFTDNQKGAIVLFWTVMLGLGAYGGLISAAAKGAQIGVKSMAHTAIYCRMAYNFAIIGALVAIERGVT